MRRTVLFTRILFHRQVDGERGPTPQLAIDGDATPQEGHQATTNREAQPRPLVLALQSGIDLTERLKELCEILFAHSDSGVFDVDAQPWSASPPLSRRPLRE